MASQMAYLRVNGVDLIEGVDYRVEGCGIIVLRDLPTFTGSVLVHFEYGQLEKPISPKSYSKAQWKNERNRKFFITNKRAS